MYLISYRVASRLMLVIVGCAAFVTLGAPAWRAVSDVSLTLAHVFLGLCQVGLSILQVCGL